MTRIARACRPQTPRRHHTRAVRTLHAVRTLRDQAVFPDYATKPPPIADLQQFYKDAKKIFDEDEVLALTLTLTLTLTLALTLALTLTLTLALILTLTLSRTSRSARTRRWSGCRAATARPATRGARSAT